MLLQLLAFLWTRNDWIVQSVAHNLRKFSFINLSFTIYRIQTFLSCCRKIRIMVHESEFKFESESHEILFGLWTIICSKLTGYTAKFALFICQGFNSLSTIISKRFAKMTKISTNYFFVWLWVSFMNLLINMKYYIFFFLISYLE